MKEEYVYHVDEEDNVIEKVSRKEMRSKNLCHRGTGILTFNSHGDILVHKRNNTKDLFPGYYDMTNGGAVEFGESYEESAKREIEEEIGAKDVKLQFLFKFKYDKGDNNCFISVYKMIYDGKITFQKEEIESGEFMSVEKLKKMINIKPFSPDSISLFNKYLEEYHDK